MLNCIKDLIGILNSQGIRYCHWKSNFYLKDALAGIGDLDLLVERQDVRRFESILASQGFKRAIDPLQSPCPSIFHFYGLDKETGLLVHLHVYYRVITGETLLKNYSFPVEELLLTNLRIVEGMPVPSKAAELTIFVLRMTVKYASFLEYLMLRRSGSNLQDELAYLLADDSTEKCSALLREWFPSVESSLFNQCRDCLQANASFARLFWLAMKLRGQLKGFRRFSSISERFLRLKLFTQLIFLRLWGAGKSKQLASGGAVIAFVGAEATGKSTLVGETASWLSQVFSVSSVHLGKPPSSWLSFLPNLTVPLFRLLASQHRASRVESDLEKQDSISWLYGIRSVLVAWDRYRLALKIRRQASNGKLVICDRYPSTVVGAMDSARLKITDGKDWRSKLFNDLASLENSIYQKIPPPDLVIRLTVPVDVAIERNQHRQKKEPEDYVLRRHTSTKLPLFGRSKTIKLDSSQPKFQTVNSVRHLVWEML